MARPKGSKNKPKAQPPAKAKAKPPAKADPPDWLRKAMAVPPRRKGRPPGTKNNRPKIEPQQAKAKRGKKPMATSKDKSFYDPMDDPDLKAPEPKASETIITPPPAKPKGTPLVAETVPEVEPLFDEVAAGEAIPAENAQALIAGTLGGGGDQHADAKRILDRMANEANWVINKGPDDTPAGMALKAKRTAREKAEKEAKDKAGKDAKGHKATKEGADARG